MHSYAVFLVAYLGEFGALAELITSGQFERYLRRARLQVVAGPFLGVARGAGEPSLKKVVAQFEQ